VGLVQGIPLLVWLFLFYFGLSVFGYNLPPWVAATLGFSVYAGAFLGESGAARAVVPRRNEPRRSSDIHRVVVM
jgi:polar amino acid transport system permease protein